MQEGRVETEDEPDEAGDTRAAGCAGDAAAVCARVLHEVRWVRAAPRLAAAAASWEMACDETAGEHGALCPLLHRAMLEPVSCADGFTYERAALAEWLLAAGTYRFGVTSFCRQPLSINYFYLVIRLPRRTTLLSDS